MPSGHQEPELTSAPEEGSYLWHLQRLHNAGILSLMAYYSAYEIRERELYKPQYRDWSEFCRHELEKSANAINRLILAASMIAELHEAGCQPLPLHPSQVRPLSLLPQINLRVIAWMEACAMKAPGHLPTRADVMREVRKLLPATMPTNAEERQIYRDLLTYLRAARTQIKEAQAIHTSPEAETWLLDRATIRQRRLLRQLVEDCRERLDTIEIDTRIY